MTDPGTTAMPHLGYAPDCEYLGDRPETIPVHDRIRVRLTAGLVATVVFLTAIAPLATDMYVPAFPAVAGDLAATATQVQLTLTTFFVGMALGQLIGGPVSDQCGRRAGFVCPPGLWKVEPFKTCSSHPRYIRTPPVADASNMARRFASAPDSRLVEPSDPVLPYPGAVADPAFPPPAAVLGCAAASRAGIGPPSAYASASTSRRLAGIISGVGRFSQVRIDPQPKSRRVVRLPLPCNSRARIRWRPNGDAPTRLGGNEPGRQRAFPGAPC